MYHFIYKKKFAAIYQKTVKSVACVSFYLQLTQCVEKSQCDLQSTTTQIHPYTFFLLSCAGSQGHQSNQTSHSTEGSRSVGEAPRQVRRHSLSRTHGFSLGPPPSGTRPEYLPSEASRSHPKGRPKSPELDFLDVEQQLYSKSQSSRGCPSHKLNQKTPHSSFKKSQCCSKQNKSMVIGFILFSPSNTE